MGRRVNKSAGRRTWWRRQLDTLDLAPGQRRKVEAAVRDVLAAGMLMAIYRTTRRTCESCVLRDTHFANDPSARCTCEVQPEIAIDVDMREPEAFYVWIEGLALKPDFHTGYWCSPSTLSVQVLR